MIFISGEIHSSKNSRQIYFNKKTKRPFVAKSKASKSDEGLLEDQFGLFRAHWETMIVGYSYPLMVHFRFIRKTKALWDFANLVQGVSDAMVKAGYLPDDSVEYFIPVYAGYEVDKNAPGVEIWVE